MECGCEFTTTIVGENSMTVLSKCRCQKHFDEQLVAEWYDEEGHHRVVRHPEDVDGLVPLVR